MNKYRLKQLLAWVLLKKLLIVNAIDVTPLNPKKFDTVILSVNASGHNSIQWDKDTDTLTTCFIGPNVCSTLNNFPGATAAVNAVTVESTITINSANETLHGGYYEATGSTPIDVTVNTLPVTIDWATQPQGNLTSAASAKWTARINCVYPASEINVHFTVYVEGVKEDSPRSPTLTTVPDSSCDSLEETVVAELTLLSSDIQQIQNQKIYIIANASHASFPNEPSVTSVQSAEAIFQLEGKSDATDDTHNTCLLVIQGVWSSVKGLLFCIIDKFAECVQFTYYVVQQWYFTCRYVFKGKVVYGLQLVIIAAITQLISMIPLILAFTVYVDNIRSYAYILIPVLFAVGPFIAVGIYLLYKRYCGQKEWLYTKFNTERATVKLSNEYGKKLNTVTKDKIYFKVKASNDLFITLLDDQQKPIVDIILGGYRQQSTHGVTQNDRVVYVKDVLVSTECRIFVLECGHSYITVTALSREIEKPLLKWELTNDDQGLEVCDIVISNFMQVGSYIRNENSTGYVQLEMTMQIENQSEIRNLEEQFGYPGEQSGNPGECTFLLRQGDCLLDNEDESCGLSCGICFVILFPIPWILCLLLRKLTDTNWIGLKLSSVLCCQNSVKPKAKEDILLNVPIVLTNISPKGGKNTLPAIGTTTTNENKPKKKKKKSRKQGESTRKTFPQDDTDNNEINTEADQYNK